MMMMMMILAMIVIMITSDNDNDWDRTSTFLHKSVSYLSKCNFLISYISSSSWPGCSQAGTPGDCHPTSPPARALHRDSGNPPWLLMKIGPPGNGKTMLVTKFSAVSSQIFYLQTDHNCLSRLRCSSQCRYSPGDRHFFDHALTCWELFTGLRLTRQGYCCSLVLTGRWQFDHAGKRFIKTSVLF